MLNHHIIPAEAEPDSGGNTTPTSTDSQQYNSRKRTILLVEDDVGMCTMLEILLEDANFGVVVAGNGKEALQVLETTQPDMILLDLRMPVMDGPTFVEHLRARGTPLPPMIIMTAYRDIDADILALGIPTINEPMKLDELLVMINQHIVHP